MGTRNTPAGRFGRGLSMIATAVAIVATTLAVTPSRAYAWSGWSEVPGGGGTVDSPASAVTQGVQYLFVRGSDNGIHVNRFASGWSGWSQLPGGGRTLSAPAAVGAAGKVYVFVRGTNNGIFQNTWDGVRWSGWGEIPGGARTTSAPAVTVGWSALHLVMRDANNRIWYKRYNFSTWTAWTQIPGNGSTASAPGIAATQGGIGVFVRGSNNGIFENTLNISFTSWTGWGELPGGGRTIAGPAASFLNSGVPARTYLVVLGSGGRIHTNTREEGGGTWRGWREIPGGRTSPSAPGVVFSSTTLANVYIRGTDNRIYRNIDV